MRPLVLAQLILFVATAFSTALAHERHGNSSANRSASNVANTPATGEVTEQHLDRRATASDRVVTEFPTLHPLIVHFPIVLILLAAVVQVASHVKGDEATGWFVIVLSFAGIVLAWLSSNVFHPHTADLSENAQRVLTEHELFAELTFWLSLGGLIAKLASRFAFRRAWWSETATTLFLIGAATAVAVTGHHGAELVHKEGVGPQGQFLEVGDDH